MFGDFVSPETSGTHGTHLLLGDVAVTREDGRDDRLPAFVEGVDDRRLRHAVYPVEDVLYLRGEDVHTADGEHVPATTDDEEVAVLVEVPDVAGTEPPAAVPLDERLLRALISLEPRRYGVPPPQQFTPFAGGHRFGRLDVLDANAEAKNVQRLFVADHSAMANGLGGPNPMNTGQALALRTADRIADLYF